MISLVIPIVKPHNRNLVLTSGEVGKSMAGNVTEPIITRISAFNHACLFNLTMDNGSLMVGTDGYGLVDKKNDSGTPMN